MYLHKHTRTIVAILLALCVVAVVLFMQIPAQTPSQSAGQPMPSGSTQMPDEPSAPNVSAPVPAQPNATSAQADLGANTPSASNVSDNASEATAHEGAPTAEATPVGEEH